MASNSVNHSDPDSELQQQGTTKSRQRRNNPALRTKNDAVMRNHLDQELNVVDLPKDYVESSFAKKGRNALSPGGGRIHIQSNSVINTYGDPIKNGHRNRGQNQSMSMLGTGTPNKGDMVTNLGDARSALDGHSEAFDSNYGINNHKASMEDVSAMSKLQQDPYTDESMDLRANLNKDVNTGGMPVVGEDEYSYEDNVDEPKDTTNYLKPKPTADKRRGKFAHPAKDMASAIMVTNPSQSMKKATQETQPDDGDSDDDNMDLAPDRAIWKLQLQVFMNHWIVQTILLIMVIYVLIADDIKMAAFPKSADDTFNVFALIIMTIFALEIFINSLSSQGYLFSFYFWLDLFSTISIITDITWIWDSIIGQTDDYQAGDPGNSEQYEKARNWARIGSRAGRITRVIRLVRLIRIGRLWKQANQRLYTMKQTSKGNDEFVQLLQHQRTIDMMKQQKKDKAQTQDLEKINKRADLLQNKKRNEQHHFPVNNVDDSSMSNMNQDQSADENVDKSGDQSSYSFSQGNDRRAESKLSVLKANGENKSDAMRSFNDHKKEQAERQRLQDNMAKNSESKVGKVLSDTTQKAVITLVLAMLLAAAVLDLQIYVAPAYANSLGLKVMAQVQNDATVFDLALDAYVDSFKDDPKPLLQIIVGDFIWSQGDDLADLRPQEKQVTFYEDPVTGVASIAVHDLRKFTETAAILGIVTTVAVCIILFIGSLVLSRVSQQLVLDPIEDMISKVRDITTNPIQAAQNAEEQIVKQEEAEKKEAREKGQKVVVNRERLETEVLQSTLNKIGGLLAIGFGESGSRIIAENMRKGDDVDPLMPGERCICIFGFCDIRRFTDATEVLQEQVMVWINEIAEIVHGVVDRYQGAANKNIGDAFVLVWKFDRDLIYTNADGTVELEESNKVSQLCDMSLISFLKIISSTKRSRKMRKYSSHAALNKRMPGYEVVMGFGLHQGWAIEGALGSFYKIDTSYLSKNYNMSMTLEESTKTYESPLLVSGALYDHLTDAAKAECRQIDYILFAGHTEPTALYTVDHDKDHLELESKRPALNKKQQRTARVKARLNRNAFKESIMLGEIDVAILFQTDNDLLEMRKKFPAVFFEMFEDAFKSFTEGNWNRARKQFRQIETIKREPDRPTQVLLEYMAEYNFVAPDDWQGYRIQKE